MHLITKRRLATALTGVASLFGAATFIAPAAEANSNDAPGLCAEAFFGTDSDTGQPIANFESPQRGSVHDIHLWIKRARGNQSGFPTNIDPVGVRPVGLTGGYVDCKVTSHWDKAVLGAGEDYSVSSVWVAYKSLSPTNFKATAFGTNANSTYWKADVNNATSSFSVPMPFGGGSNWSTNPPGV